MNQNLCSLVWLEMAKGNAHRKYFANSAKFYIITVKKKKKSEI